MRHFGCSNMRGRSSWPGSSPPRPATTCWTAASKRGLIPAASPGVALLPYYPLANGLLSGKYRRGEDPRPGSRLSWREGWLTDAALDRVEALTAYGAERGRPSSRWRSAGSPHSPGSAPSSAER